ncbi:hypothetical protein GCM10023188_29180 [Pontibacter saemangeumensis]|uniref:Uncharacterized protein n=1 Tax=Pontibacter saemangeumensis TaxID=1084525 RepID=A0ABP8LVC3_9BACT
MATARNGKGVAAEKDTQGGERRALSLSSHTTPAATQVAVKVQQPGLKRKKKPYTMVRLFRSSKLCMIKN